MASVPMSSASINLFQNRIAQLQETEIIPPRPSSCPLPTLRQSPSPRELSPIVLISPLPREIIMQSCPTKLSYELPESDLFLPRVNSCPAEISTMSATPPLEISEVSLPRMPINEHQVAALNNPTELDSFSETASEGENSFPAVLDSYSHKSSCVIL